MAINGIMSILYGQCKSSGTSTLFKLPVVLQIPTVGFLYIAGYIGYVGRDYIKEVKKEKKPTQKEIIIDVPFAIKLAFQGVGWPFRAIQELRAGTLTEDDSKITVSPR